MRLVASGQVELEAPMRRYVPDLRLKDEQAADVVTVQNLLKANNALVFPGLGLGVAVCKAR